MRYCAKCNKELGRTTKGDLCQLCYRNRNNVTHQISVAENELHSDGNSSCDSSIVHGNTMGAEVNRKTSDINNCDKSIIDFLKDTMLQERDRGIELITVLKDQITFLKEEMKHKNDIIHKLMHDSKVSVYCDHKRSTHRNIIDSGNSINSNYITTKTDDNDSPFLTNYMQWQHINDAHETSVNHTNDACASYVKDPLVDELSAISN